MPMTAVVTKKLWSAMSRVHVLRNAVASVLASRKPSNPLLTSSNAVSNAPQDVCSTSEPMESQAEDKSTEKVPQEQLQKESMAEKKPFSTLTSGLTMPDLTSDASSSPPATTTQLPPPSPTGYLGGVFSYFFPPKTTQSIAASKANSKSGTSTVAAVVKQLPSVRPMSRTDIESRTKGLVRKLLLAESLSSRILRTQEMCSHLIQHPDARNCAIKELKLLPRLLHRLKYCKDVDLRALTRECVTLLGYTFPPRGEGIRILSIDGGGTRGMMGLEILEALEKACGGLKICQLFDYIVGVSTGSIIACLLGGFRYDVHQCRQIYMDLSQELFSGGSYSGLLLSHSYYNTKKYVEILKRTVGIDNTLLDTCRMENTPKLAFVSCIMNRPQLQPFIFRNYEHAVGRDSHFPGSCAYTMWQALQATASPPGYFEEVILDQVVLQDGGILVNNPTSVGVHEARALWPYSPIQCLVSVGNGRSEAVPTDFSSPPKPSGLQEKITKIVDSATDTELVHTSLRDLLPPTDYFRLNPYMSHAYTLDEINVLKLRQMQEDARLYVRKNARKIEAAGKRLIQSRTLSQRIHDRLHYEKTLRLGWYTP